MAPLLLIDIQNWPMRAYGREIHKSGLKLSSTFLLKLRGIEMNDGGIHYVLV